MESVLSLCGCDLLAVEKEGVGGNRTLLSRDGGGVLVVVVDDLNQRPLILCQISILIFNAFDLIVTAHDL